MEKVQDFYNHLKERLSSPFFSAFIISWSIFNWEALVCLVMFDAPMLDKVFYQTYTCCISDQTTILSNLVCPFLSAILYTFGYPIFKGLLNVFNSKINKTFGNWDVEVKKGTAIEIDKFIAMQDEVEKLQKTLKTRIESTEDNIVKYNQQVTLTQQKESEISDLKAQMATAEGEQKQQLADVKSDLTRQLRDCQQKTENLQQKIKSEEELTKTQTLRLKGLSDEVKTAKAVLADKDNLIDNLSGGDEVKRQLEGYWTNDHRYKGFASRELLRIDNDLKYYSFNGLDFIQIATVTNLSLNSYSRKLVFSKELIEGFAYAESKVLPPRGMNLLNQLTVSDDWNELSGSEDSVISIQYKRISSEDEIVDAKNQMSEKFGVRSTRIYFEKPRITEKTNSEFIPSDFLFKDQGSISVWVRPSSPRSILLGAKEKGKRVNNMYVLAHAAPTYDDKSGSYTNVFALSLSPDASESNLNVQQMELYWRLSLSNGKGDKLVFNSLPIKNDRSEWTHLFVRWNHTSKVRDFYVDGLLVETNGDWSKYWPELTTGTVVVGSWGNDYPLHLLKAPIFRLQVSEGLMSNAWMEEELKRRPTRNI